VAICDSFFSIEVASFSNIAAPKSRKCHYFNKDLLMPKIEFLPGRKDELNWDSGDWIFLDVGFSATRKTCGLLLPHSETDLANPSELLFTYGEMCKKVVSTIRERKSPINLMIEAPLSMSFDERDNPTGRKYLVKKNGNTTEICFELNKDRKHRYWNEGAGCCVMTASMVLLKKIATINVSTSVRIFEAFISFKKRSGLHSTSHGSEVLALRKCVEDNSFAELIEPVKCISILKLMGVNDENRVPLVIKPSFF